MIIQNFPLHQNHLFKINLLLNTTEIFLVSESCLMEVWSFHKIIVLSESPHLMGFLEGFQILKQNSEYMSNDPLMRCTCWITKSFCLWCWPAFWRKSQMPNQEGLILGLLPHCTEQNFSQMPREREGWAVWHWLVHYSIHVITAFWLYFNLKNIQKLQRNSPRRWGDKELLIN